MESKKILETDGNQATDKDDDDDKENINAVARPDVNRIENSENLDARCSINRTQNSDTLADASAGSYVEARNKLPDGFGFTSKTIKFRIHPNHGDVRLSAENAEGSYHQNIPEDSSRQIPSKNKSDRGKIIEESFEFDTIYTRKLQEVVLSEPPRVPIDYVDMSPSNLPTDPKRTLLCIPIGLKKPDQKTTILIPHDNADNPSGDEFGATLCTYKERRKDGTIYYRQFLVDVDPSGPAYQMKIKDDDEIVLLNEVFAPELSHKELLEKFRAVKVDGQTRFTLVIRRVENKKKWKWIETSAILAPDEVVEDRPHVEQLRYRRLENEEIEVPKSKHLYKVPGTQKYLDICYGEVTIGILKGDSTDRTKIIWKRAKYWEDDDNTGLIDFAAALCDVSERWYIGINKQEQIVLDDKPLWFKMIKIGSKIRFQFKEVYLGYDKESGEVKAEVSQCVFEEIPAPVDGFENLNEMVREPEQETEDEATFDSTSKTGSELSSIGDHTSRRNTGSSNSKTDISKSDSDRSIASSISSAYSDISFASSVANKDSEKRSIALSQTSVESDRGSILSSQVSVDEFGEVGSCSNKMFDYSCSSGYRSENSAEDVDFSPVKDAIVNIFESSCGDEGSAVKKDEFQSNDFKM